MWPDFQKNLKIVFSKIHIIVSICLKIFRKSGSRLQTYSSPPFSIGPRRCFKKLRVKLHNHSTVPILGLPTFLTQSSPMLYQYYTYKA